MYRTSERTSVSRKMAALEDRWRKSQEDRYILELKFKEVMKGLADKHEGNKLLRIKEKYNRFLANEDSRNDRNDKILRTLDKIESQATMLSAKTERLKLLKLHYEAYMKRMYPKWTEELNGGGNIENKDPAQSVGRKYEQKHISYSASREEYDHRKSYKSPYHPPRNSERSVWNHSNMMHELNHAPQLRKSPTFQSGNTKPRYSNSDGNVARNLNHEFSRVQLNSEEKTSSSHGLSGGQEENTSKDLLNLSLSDDNVINDYTVPVEVEKAKADIRNKLYSDLKTAEKGNERVQDWNRSAKSNTDYRYEEEDDRGEYPRPRNTSYGSNDEGTSFKNDHLSYDGHNGYPRSSQRKDYELKGGNLPEEATRPVAMGGDVAIAVDSLNLNPSVVVTQPTPDIGISSSEDDISGRGFPLEDEKPENRGNVPPLENSGITSEAEVSEAEVIPHESGDELSKEVEPSANSPLRLTSSLGHNQGKLEESYQFSSSDADYDELENQMAALVEGKRQDESDEKDIPLSVNNENHDVPASGVDEVGNNQLSEPNVTEDETKDVEYAAAELKAEDGGSHVEKLDSVDSQSETGHQEEYNEEHQQYLRSESDEREVDPSNKENEGEGDVQASYQSDEPVKNVEMGRSVDYSTSDEDGITNTNMNSVRINESYERRDEKIERDDSFRGDDKGLEESQSYHEEQEENLDGQDSEVEHNKREYLHEGDPSVELEEKFENEEGDDVREDRYSEEEGLDDRNNDHSAENVHDSHSIDVKPEGGGFQEEYRHSDDETDVQDGRQVGIEYDNEPRGELSEEEGRVEEPSGRVLEAHENVDEVVEGIESDVEHRNQIERESEETEYYSREDIGEEVSYDVEDKVNDPEELEHERYETIDEQKGEEEYYQQNLVEEQGDVHQEEDLGEKHESDREEVTVQREEYEQREVDPEESTDVIDNEAELANYPEDEGGRTVESPIVYSPHGSDDAQETLVTEQEPIQYESQIPEENVEEVPNVGVHEEEKVPLKESTEEKEIYQEMPPGEQGGSNEQRIEERKDNLTPEPELPLKEIAIEKTEVVKDDQATEVKSRETKKSDVPSRSGTPIERTNVPVTGEGRKTSQNAASKEQNKGKRSGEEVKSGRETPNIPSRPLSRQSTRRDGPSQDLYKAEKLKTAVRKFQAKKDSRQTARKPLDSRK